MARVPERFGEYRISSVLVRHPSGRTIFVAAHQDRPERPVALKVLYGAAVIDHLERERFLHEAELIRAIDHPRIVPIFDAGAVGEDLFIAAELVDGCTVGEIIRLGISNGDPPPISVAIGIVAGALEGLIALHEARDPRHDVTLEAIHRDISPGNIIVDRRGWARIIDLGFGRSLLKTWRTATGAVFGTPGYISPEQALGQRADLRADLYAIGVLLYELLTINRYIRQAGPLEMFSEAARRVPNPPSDHRREISAELDRVVMRAVALAPEDRFASARELREALLAAARGEVADDAEIARALAPVWSRSRVHVELEREWVETELIEKPSVVEVASGDVVQAEQASEPASDTPVLAAKAAVLPAPRREAFRAPWGLYLVLTALAAATGYAAFYRQLEVVPVQLSATPRPPKPIALEREREPEPESEPAPLPLEEPAREAPRPIKRAPRIEQPAPKRELDPDPDPEERLRRFADRATALKRRRPELSERVNGLLAESVMWSYAGDLQRRSRGIAELERQLEQLDRGSP